MYKKFYGWKIVVACGFIYALVGALGLTVGQVSLSYMALDPAVTMDRAMLGLGFTLFVLAQGLPGPLIGQLVSKKGARFAYICGASAVIVVGLLLSKFLGSSTIFYLVGFGILLSLSCTTAGQIPGQSTLTNWFVAKRGKAISYMMTMAAIIAVAYPIVTNALIKHFDSWRVGFVMIACFALVGLLIAIFFVKNKPADIGQEPDGGVLATPDSDQSKPVKVSKVYQAAEHKTASQALRTPAFWFIVITAFTCFAALNLCISQGPLHFVEQGSNMDIVTTAISVKSVAGIVALLICSVLLDKVEPIRVHGIATLLMGIGALLAAFSGSTGTVFIYYICIGAGYACQTACMPTELANYFGNTNYPKILGFVLPIIAVLASLVPTIAGRIFDVSGSYQTAFIILAVIGLIGFISSCLVRFPRKKK
ncbi:MAG: MFS transporter [Clostridiales bacterium]|nr:MFS transporter [Clostridiales bacterium]